MRAIKQSIFRYKIQEMLGRDVSVISTFDHPFASFPIRIIDGHYQLKKIEESGEKCLICILDINQPDADHYRTDLIFDSGILACRDSDLMIFNKEEIYPLQRPEAINFHELGVRLELIFERINNLDGSARIINKQRFNQNLYRLVNIYQRVIAESLNGTEFYESLIIESYNLLSLPIFSDLCGFFQKNKISYFNSPLSKEWIAYCIEATGKELFGFFNLLKLNIFSKPPFRFINQIKNYDILSCNKYILDNIDYILKLLINGEIVPSYQVFFWTLALAGIKHFGNDYNFFGELFGYLNKKQIRIEDYNLQLTRHNEDSRHIIIFERDASLNCKLKNDQYHFYKKNPIKIMHRASTFSALYLHLGTSLALTLKDLLEEKVKFPQFVKMGEFY